MRISRLFAAVAAVSALLLGGGQAVADTGPQGSEAAAPSEVRWEDFDDPSFDPGLVGAEDTTPTPSVRAHRAHRIGLGPVVIDSEGHRGRIHRVVAGDTLWDISEAYLGTPWVWPSVWRENEAIENPHVIVPDDRIWISSTEMRRLTPSEADELLANQVVEALVPVPAPEAKPESNPAVDPIEPAAPLTAGSASAGSLSLASAMPGPKSSETGRTLRLPRRGDFGYVSNDGLDGASSIVGSPSVRTWLAAEDLVYLGLGEGEVEVGHEFTIFRDAEAIRDVRTDAQIGYHVNVLGWARVVSVERESAVALIINSNSEIERGDLVVPREVAPAVVAVKRTTPATVGHIVYLPASRTVMGMGDYVYIDRGTQHGIEVGSELEVIDSGFNATDRVRQSTVLTRDEVIATLVVVDLQPTSAVAYVAHTRRELEVGNVFRTAAPNDSLASAP